MGTNWDKWFNKKHPEALSQVTLLECVWTDCPVDVQDEAARIWEDYSYGNDSFYHNWYWGENDRIYPIIYKYLIEHNIKPETPVLIHFWW